MSETDATPTATHPPITRPLLILLLVLACLAVLARVTPHPRTIDDAFITFRYSRNLVNGEGFVYNPGSRTLGTTTPLFTLVMAGIGFVTGSGEYPWLALIVNALADMGTVCLLALLAYRLSHRLTLAAILGGLWAVSPMSVTFAIGGMETSVAILWIVAAAYAHLLHRDRWVAVFAALGILTRIDSLIWVGPLLLHQFFLHWRETRTGSFPHDWRGWLARVPWQSWAIFVAILAPWYLFSWVYFGTLLSRSLSAKRLAYVVPELHATTRFLQHIATPFLDHETLGVPGIVIGIVLYPGLAGIGTYYAIRRYPRLVPFLAYPWLYVITFSAMNPLIFRWYLAPILPAYFLAILLGVWALADSITGALGRPQALPAVLGAVGAIFLALSLNTWTLHPDHGPDRPAPNMAFHDIELNYKVMGDILRYDCGVTGDTVVAAGDIGAVGYYSRAHILDTVGLVTPELSDYYPLDRDILVSGKNYAVPPAIIFDYEPDYIVFMEMFVRNGLMSDEYRADFEALYEQIHFIATDYYGDGMILYRHTSKTPDCIPRHFR